jgi:gamma-glutamyltranspeptidase/glutathione hydrolase
MVSADDRVAAEWGAEILRQGGNAVDAAVATAFALAVTRPHYAALGGGGFLVFCPAPGAEGPRPCRVIDYREEAPGAATRDMYVRDGKARTDLSQDGPLAPGVPGTTAGLLLALEKHGTMPRAKLLRRPIELARGGTVFSGHMENAALERWEAMNAEARKLFGCGGAKPCEPGTLLRQPELAKVLEEISRLGAKGFYEGWVARKISEGIRAAGGIMTAEDLAAYRAREREPITGTYRGMEIVTMPPPSAGGTVILQLFRFAELAEASGAFDEGFGSARAIHAVAHGMALGFADRASYFGDPDHVRVPVQGLLAGPYLEKRWKDTYRDGCRAKDLVAGGPTPPPAPGEGTHTTHLSVIDRYGNAVALTTTVNDNFGSGFVPPGTGVVMNNEMDDFAIQAGVPNIFGLVGADANAVAPRKRPLSSMSPTIVRDREGRARISIGAQGGPRITTAVFQALFNRLRFGMALPDAVIAPRFHHQWKPDLLHLEANGFGADARRALAKMGYELKDITASGRMHGIERFPETGRTWGVSDPRAEGGAIAE